MSANSHCIYSCRPTQNSTLTLLFIQSSSASMLWIKVPWPSLPGYWAIQSECVSSDCEAVSFTLLSYYSNSLYQSLTDRLVTVREFRQISWRPVCRSRLHPLKEMGRAHPITIAWEQTAPNATPPKGAWQQVSGRSTHVHVNMTRQLLKEMERPLITDACLGETAHIATRGEWCQHCISRSPIDWSSQCAQTILRARNFTNTIFWLTTFILWLHLIWSITSHWRWN